MGRRKQPSGAAASTPAPGAAVPPPVSAAAPRRPPPATGSSARPRAPGWRAWLGVALLLALAGTAAYWNALHTPFHFDDVDHLCDNPALRQWSTFNEVVPMRPVLGATLIANYQLGQLDVVGYHAVNVAIHVLAGVLLWALVLHTLRTPRLAPTWGAAAGGLSVVLALLWVLHPLQTQAVTYVIQRGEALASLFYLLALYAAARAAQSPRAGWWWGLVVVASLLSVFSKQIGFSIPFTIALYYWVFYPATRWQERLLWWLPAVVAWLLLGLWLARAAAAEENSVGSHLAFGPLAYAITQAPVLTRYLQLSVFPLHQSLDYSWTVIPLATAAPYLLAWLALGGATLWGLWRRAAWSFPAGAFFLILAPTSSFLPIADVIEEHRMYLALACVLSGLVLGLGWLSQRALPARPALLVAVVGVAAALGLGWLTHQRNKVYVSDEALWGNALQVTPHNPRAFCNYGSALLAQDRLPEAIAAERAALAINPDYPEALGNLGSALMKQGHYEEACRELEHARRAMPTSALAARLHATCLLKLDRPAESLAAAQAALQLRPAFPEAMTVLAESEFRLNRPKDAVAHFEQALRMATSDFSTHNNYGCALLDLGQVDDAMQQFSTARSLAPKAPDSYLNMGSVFVRQGQYEAAEARFREALALAPGSLEAHISLATCLRYRNLPQDSLPLYEWALARAPDRTDVLANYGGALATVGRFADAETQLRRAIALNPRFADAQFNLGQLLSNSDRPAEAITHYRAVLAVAPGRVDVMVRLAATALRTGDVALAREQLATALKLQPGQPEATQLLAQLPPPPAP